MALDLALRRTVYRQHVALNLHIGRHAAISGSMVLSELHRSLFILCYVIFKDCMTTIHHSRLSRARVDEFIKTPQPAMPSTPANFLNGARTRCLKDTTRDPNQSIYTNRAEFALYESTNSKQEHQVYFRGLSEPWPQHASFLAWLEPQHCQTRCPCSSPTSGSYWRSCQ